MAASLIASMTPCGDAIAFGTADPATPVPLRERLELSQRMRDFAVSELKLPGMASDFYRTQVNRHLLIGMRSMEILRDLPPEKLHSRKLRSFAETAFQ